MTTFFNQYIDLFVMVMCFVCTLINTIRMVRRATVRLRKVPAYFVVFGATANATFMGFGHLFEISFHAVERAMAGTFVYDFRFYSLILMGMLLLALSVRLLRAIDNWFQNVPGSRRTILTNALLIIIVSAPAVAFSPIAYMPSIACGILGLAMPFVIKRRAIAELAQDEAMAATTFTG